MNRRYLVLGCEVEAGNLGVSALGHSLVRWLREADKDCEITVQAPGRLETFEAEMPSGRLTLESTPLHYSRSYRARYGTRRLQKLYAMQKFFPVGNRALTLLEQADAIVDVSAGDSFTEIYGERRFNVQCSIKEFVLSLGRPLVLAPQTIGPFVTEEARCRVRRILDQCALVATRDAFGLDELCDLMGREPNERFQVCPDIAFGLEPVGTWSPTIDAGVPNGSGLIGVNVSGLLFREPERFGLKSDHFELIKQTVRMFLAETNCHILLVPHVLPEDEQACDAVNQEFANSSDRVSVLRGVTTAPQVKQVIGCCDFFVGARMHACIAALSQSVPTAALAYSKKVSGVMDKLGVPQATVDLRDLDLIETLDATKRLYRERRELRAALNACVPQVLDELRVFFNDRFSAAIYGGSDAA